MRPTKPPASRLSASRPFPRARRRPSGPARSRPPTRSAAAIARIAMWRRSFPTPPVGWGSNPMRSIRSAPRRSGRRARKWSPSASDRRRGSSPASPSVAHLGLHLLQSLRAAHAELHLVPLEAGDDAAPAHLHTGAKPCDVRLAVFYRLGLLGQGARSRGRESREHKRGRDGDLTNSLVSPPSPVPCGGGTDPYLIGSWPSGGQIKKIGSDLRKPAAGAPSFRPLQPLRPPDPRSQDWSLERPSH